MAKKPKGKKARRQPKKRRSTWLLAGLAVLLMAGAGTYILAQSRPAYGSLSAIGQGKPVIVEVFLPT